MSIIVYNQNNMNDITIFNDEYKNKFRTLILDGKTIKETNEILNFNQGTFDSYFYGNKHGLRDYVQGVKKEKMIVDAERVSSKILAMDTVNNAKMLAIQQKESEFIRETQGKDQGYSKRIETIGFNVNKNEPLDDDQKAKLDKLIKTSGNKTIKDVDYVVDTTPYSSEDVKATE